MEFGWVVKCETSSCSSACGIVGEGASEKRTVWDDGDARCGNSTSRRRRAFVEVLRNVLAKEAMAKSKSQ